MYLENRIQADFSLKRSTNFQLEVKLDLPGEGISVIYGPTGSGKSTLLRAIAGLEPKVKGIFQFNGICWQNDEQKVFLPPHERLLGMVFQEAALFPHLSIAKNLNYGLHRIDSSMQRVKLQQTIDRLELGSLLDRLPQQLSVGERQRVALARAVLRSPRLLLLDEPFSAMDMDRKKDLIPYLQRLQEALSIPVIYVTHALEELVQLADAVVIMDQGRVEVSGSYYEVIGRLDSSLAYDDRAGTLIETTVESHHPDFQLTSLQFQAGRFLMPRLDAVIGKRLRIRIPANQISLSLQEPQNTSNLNIFPVIVDEIFEVDSYGCLVKLNINNTQFVAKIPRYSLDRLQLKVGSAVFAQIHTLHALR